MCILSFSNKTAPHLRCGSEELFIPSLPYMVNMISDSYEFHRAMPEESIVFRDRVLPVFSEKTCNVLNRIAKCDTVGRQIAPLEGTMRRRGICLTALLLCCALLSACGITKTTSDKLSVVATIFPEYDFARAVAGDLAELQMLIKPGAESHSYEPTPQDVIAIQNCDVFICAGGQNDSWAQKILAGLDTQKMQIVRLLDIVEPYEEEHAEGEEHAHEYDEHVWTSPVNAMQIVSAIADAFAAADPQNERTYRENAAAYNDQISAVDEEIRSIVSQATRRELIFGDRFPFLYLAKEYALSWASPFAGCSTDAEASAATIAELIDKVQKQNVPVVCYIELSTHRIADAICEATGAVPMLLHSCHNVTKEEFGAGETYVSLMRKNCDTLREALCK